MLHSLFRMILKYYADITPSLYVLDAGSTVIFNDLIDVTVASVSEHAGSSAERQGGSA